jgi:hypothetical protein
MKGSIMNYWMDRVNAAERLEKMKRFREPYGKGVKFTYNKIWGNLSSGGSLYMHTGEFGTIVKLRLGPDLRYESPIYLNCRFKYPVHPQVIYYIFYTMMEADEFKFMEYIDTIGKAEIDMVHVTLSIERIGAF